MQLLIASLAGLVFGIGLLVSGMTDPARVLGFLSVTGKLFALPDDTRIRPGHDYHGQAVSTIGWEKRHNARPASRSREDFVRLMAALDLPRPKLLDVAVPANRNLGLPHG